MKYYLKKILGFIFTILLVSIITFVVFQILPGDPAQIILGVDADPAQLENLRATMNLDKGYVERYFIWLINALHGDLGVSYRYSREVSDLIAESFFCNKFPCSFLHCTDRFDRPASWNFYCQKQQKENYYWNFHVISAGNLRSKFLYGYCADQYFLC